MNLFNKKTVSIITFTFLMALAVYTSIRLVNVDAQSTSSNMQKYYTSIQIKAGDTLSSIAQKYMTDDYASIDDYVTEVKELNGISSNDIHAGNNLIVIYYSDESK